jgi:hypothetical protein
VARSPGKRQRRLRWTKVRWFRVGESQAGVDPLCAVEPPRKLGRERKLPEEEAEALRQLYREAVLADPTLRGSKALGHLRGILKSPPEFDRTLRRRVIEPVLRELKKLGQN